MNKESNHSFFNRKSINDNEKLKHTAHLYVKGDVGKCAKLELLTGPVIIKGNVKKNASIILQPEEKSDFQQNKERIIIYGNVENGAEIKAQCADIYIYGKIEEGARVKTNRGHIYYREVEAGAVLKTASSERGVGNDEKESTSTLPPSP